MYSLGSLFSGIDGIALAFERRRFRTRWHVEQNEFCRRILATRFPHSQIFEDVRYVGKEQLRTVDVMAGGFPCQDISTAGKRAGIKGERSGLWFDFARIIGELRPAVVFLENTDGIVAPIRERGTGNILDRAPAFAVLGSLAEMGFDAQWGVVPASATGAPHKRERWWCVAWSVSNSNSIRRHKQATIEKYSRNLEWQHEARSGERRTVFHETVAGGQGNIELSSTESLRLSPSGRSGSRDEAKVSSIASDHGKRISDQEFRNSQRKRLEGQSGQGVEDSAQLTQGFERDNESDLGGIVFDGLSRRLVGFANSQLWAARLGEQPHSYEPSRLVDHGPEWKNRVQAIGNSVVVPVVQAFAEGIEELLDVLYA